jgi:hypothetical protein
MADADPIAVAHPAPHRDRVRLTMLAVSLVAAPLAWATQLWVSYALASQVCFPSSRPGPSAAIELGTAWLTLFLVDLVALAVTIAAMTMSYSSWRSTRGEAAGDTRHMFEAGEGRTRFLALWGLLTAAGFIIAILFGLVGLFVVPLCLG